MVIGTNVLVATIGVVTSAAKSFHNFVLTMTMMAIVTNQLCSKNEQSKRKENNLMKFKTYVPPSGQSSASIVFVGEQPGKVEVQRRRPFVGPAGRELNECMLVAGIQSFECYFNNVVKGLDKTIHHYISIKGK